MTPGTIRFAASAFVALGTAIVANTMFMQNDPAAIAEAKSSSERAAAKAELQRIRRLSIDAIDRKTARKRVQQRTRVAKRKKSTRQEQKSDRSIKRMAQLQQDAGALGSASGGEGPLSAKRTTVRAIQRELTARHYQPGLIDGVPGLMTRAAIMAYENDQGMLLTGEPSEGLLQRIIFGETYVGDNMRSGPPSGARPHTEQVIRTVQQSLATLGYHHGPADGAIGDVTSRAIREFEMDYGLQQSGRISGHLVAKLAKLAGQGRLAARQRKKK